MHIMDLVCIKSNLPSINSSRTGVYTACMTKDKIYKILAQRGIPDDLIFQDDEGSYRSYYIHSTLFVTIDEYRGSKIEEILK